MNMSKRALIAGASAAAALAAAYVMLSGRHEPERDVAPAPPDAGVAPAAQAIYREDGRSLIPPPLPPSTKPEPRRAEEKKSAEPPPVLEAKDDPLHGLELEEPTSA